MQVDELNACWNNVFRKIFGYRRYKSVKYVIYGPGRLKFEDLLFIAYSEINDCTLDQACYMTFSGLLCFVTVIIVHGAFL